MKDLFSSSPALYFRYRPAYPVELFDFMLSVTAGREAALDSGTGNGQAAAGLSKHFKRVFATDISGAQLRHAIQKPNIEYRQESAEATSFPDECFDLAVAAQSVHWFDFIRYYAEMNRVLKPGGTMVIAGYSLFTADEAIDGIMRHFYRETVGPYWEKERKYIDEKYRTIPFPFEELPAPQISMQCRWTPEQLLGYLNTWSAVHAYKEKNNVNPVGLIAGKLMKDWGEEEQKTITFPLWIRAGKKAK